VTVDEFVARRELGGAGAYNAFYRIAANSENSGRDDHDECDKECILNHVLTIIPAP
jgi:hypothetical protein